jgi:hypothetical protein
VAGVQRRLDSGVFRTFDGFVGTAGLAEKVHVGGPQGTMAVCRVEDGRVVLESLPDLGITVR